MRPDDDRSRNACHGSVVLEIGRRKARRPLRHVLLGDPIGECRAWRRVAPEAEVRGSGMTIGSSKIKLMIAVATTFASAAFILASYQASADSPAPYRSMPKQGDSVRLDGTLGGATTAWAYADRKWLERYLQVTIDAAAANRSYSDSQVQSQLATVADHVMPVPNGTGAMVETVQPFSYGGRADTEVRVMIKDGPLKGRELWTTCAELVDSAGHPFLQM